METASLKEVSTRLPPDAHIGRVRLRVADIERSLGFYRDMLGMRIAREDGPEVMLAPGSDVDSAAGESEPRELLVLQEIPGLAPRPRRPVTTGLYHVALLVPSRRALGRALLGLRAARYPLRGMSDHAVSESLYLDDPDGNGLEIYADRPRSSWQFRDGEIYITTEPMDLEGVITAASEQPESWRGLPHETVIGHVHFTVSHLEPAVVFYRDVLGFDVTLRWPTLVGVAAGGYHHHLNLNTWAGTGAAPDSDNVAGLSGWELIVPDREGRKALIERLVASGIPVEVTRPRIAACDPDGILVEVPL
ncbi:MAG TPA: VOC family protein [Rhodothermales bacterium]|nr:VOC family protein [Rhodothermales bacterium]